MPTRFARLLAALGLGLTLVACQGSTAGPSPVESDPASAPPASAPGTSPVPSPSTPPVIFPGPTDGPEKLLADLEAAGAAAKVGQLFAGDPFDAQGGLLCIGKEPVQLYVFGSVRDREAAVERIDPEDPSNMGTAIVDWNGRPRLWARDRMIVVYLGEDVATETLLRSILGEPFASGEGRPPLLGPNPCA